MPPKPSIFSEFTNLYSLTKTLRFELRPYLDSQTEKNLPNLIPLDEKRAENYKKLKLILDELHNHFIQESLSLVSFDKENLTYFENVYLELKLKNKNRRENEAEIKILEDKLDKIKSFLRKEIVSSYIICSEKWKEKYPVGLKDSGYKILTEAKILDVLKIIHKDDIQKLEILNFFNGFWTYFGGFNQNRENYYSSESKSTSIANRSIDENLTRFIDNIDYYKKITPQIPDLLKFEEKFKLENYSKILNQVGIDNFNADIVAKINADVNQFNQQKYTKLSTLNLLYKQIGSDKNGFEMFEIRNGNEWIELENLIFNQNSMQTDEGLERPNIETLKKLFSDFFQNIESEPIENIYFHKPSINTISSIWFKSWETLGSLLKEAKIGNVKFTGGEYKIPKYISLKELKDLLTDHKHLEFDDKGEPESSLFRGGKDGTYKNIYDESAWITLLRIWKFEIDTKFNKISEVLEEFSKSKNQEFDKNKHITIVKEVCDAYLGLAQMLKYHLVKESIEKNNNFNKIIEDFLQFSELDKYYNAFRNHLSKKTFNIEKFKLNFENSTLLGGWDLNKESDNTSIILKNGNQFELIILDNKNGKHCFSNKKNDNLLFKDDGSGMQKMVYKLLPGPNKMLPKVAFSNKNINFFKPDQDILRIYDSGTFKKENFVKEDLTKMIDFWKQVLSTHPEWKEFKMKFKESDSYNGIDEFYSEVAKQGYKIEFVPINKTELEKLENEGKIYRFKIHNKDWQENSKGRKNLETIYFENLFTKENLENPCLKLNGEGEIFRRPLSKSLVKNQKKNLAGKSLIKGKNENKKVYENERYTEDKLFFHIPISLNFSSENLNGVTKFNEKIYDAIQNNLDDVHIIGIDRGEKHLLYYTVINLKGEIIEQNSLNRITTKKLQNELEVKYDTIDGEYKNVRLENTGKLVKYADYHVLLDYFEKKRKESRQSWQEIGNIKELKSGYLSHVVHKLYQLVLKYNGIIILEDLNSGFKIKQTAKVEKAVYQKFELALAKKLNYLVLKNDIYNTENEILPCQKGGVLNAYQLTPIIGAGDVKIFERSKQWGNIFYVTPDYTSSIDPITGWRKHIYAKNSETIENIKAMFNPDTGINISYDTIHECFVFSYKEPTLNKEWKLYAFKGLERCRWNPKTKSSDTYKLFEELEKLFAKYTDRNRLLNSQILDDKENFSWKNLIFYWNLLNEIRYTDKDGKDVIQSPVWSDKINAFFDTRKVEIVGENGENSEFPINGDANGDFNIAKKGLILVDRIKKLDLSEKNAHPDLFISKTDWDVFSTRSKPTIKSLLS
jgi:hypothetical protein